MTSSVVKLEDIMWVWWSLCFLQLQPSHRSQQQFRNGFVDDVWHRCTAAVQKRWSVLIELCMSPALVANLRQAVMARPVYLNLLQRMHSWGPRFTAWHF
jgi:hypothetical protein